MPKIPAEQRKPRRPASNAQGEAARRRAARYTPAAMAEQMAEIYRDALARRTQAA